MLAEPQHDAELFGLDAEKSGQAPDRKRCDQQQRDAHAAEIAAWQNLLQLVLAASEQILQIRRPRSDRLRAGAPRSLGARTPRASALILPWHRQSPPRAKHPASQTLHGLIGDRPGPYNAACCLQAAKPEAI